MSNVFRLTLGIVTAVGGFVDVGELVFASQAGARFGYALLWPLLVGVCAIATYGEMCGRVAIVADKPVFVLVRERLGRSLGLCVLAATLVVNVLTCAAEVGGIAILLRLFTGLPYGLFIGVAIIVVIAVVSFVPFEPLERIFGLMGLFMLTFVVAALALGVDWDQAARGLVPHIPQSASGNSLASYGYFAVGLIAATVMPYEAQSYSSGNVEEDLKPSDLRVNTATAVVGFAFGAVVAAAIVVLGAQVLEPAQIVPTQLGTAMLGPIEAFGAIGLLGGLLGALFAVAGASIETSLAGAYSIAQFAGFHWGQRFRPWRVPQFSLSWLMVFGLALIVLATNVDPIEVTEYAVVFSVVVLPLTYLPILVVARDRREMGEYANNRLQDVAGAVFLVVITVVAIAAVPLMLLSRLGQA